MSEPNELQRVDLNKIRKHLADAKELAPQIEELCDLVEGSTLLKDAETARINMVVEDLMSGVKDAEEGETRGHDQDDEGTSPAAS